MNPMQDLIHAMVENKGLALSDEDKKKYEVIMKKIFEEHMKPKDVLGFSDEMIEYTYGYGYRLYNNGNYKKAEQVFTALTSLDPTSARFSLARAAAHHRLGHYGEAVEEYYKSGILDPSSPLPFFYMYECYTHGKLIEDAIICLEEAVKRSGDKKEFASLKTRSLMILDGLKNPKKAEEKEEVKKKS